ncbi:MAG: L-lysine 6-transaminase [Methanobacteriota archaeon]|nr:MAG: L-lysine 6-transaminase [Euryarchaeota archaeon]
METSLAKSGLEHLKKHILVDGYPFILDLEKSFGSELYDSSGRRFLDMMSFYASMPLGMNHPIFNEPEARHELLLAAKNKISNSDFYTESYIDFVETFAKIAVPSSFPHMFFISGGALAVENALKAAFDWKVRKNLGNGKGEIGHQVIHFKEAFHGRSGYTLSLTNTADPRKYMYFPKFDWPRVINPKITFPLEENIEEVRKLERKALDQIQTAIEQRGDDIASIIIEPIQGEGGDNHFRDEFFVELRRIADEAETMLIFDEVQTGLGLTGEMWYLNHLPIQPDLVSFGKKTQVCGFFSNKRIEEVEGHVFEESSRINSTWGGNLVDMVRSKYYLRVIENENILANVKKQGEYLDKLLHELSETHEGIISNVRRKGLFAAFDLPHMESRDQLQKQLFKDGVLILKSGVQSIRFRPALNVQEEQLDEAVGIIDTAIKAIKL